MPCRWFSQRPVSTSPTSQPPRLPRQQLVRRRCSSGSIALVTGFQSSIEQPPAPASASNSTVSVTPGQIVGVAPLGVDVQRQVGGRSQRGRRGRATPRGRPSCRAGRGSPRTRSWSRPARGSRARRADGQSRGRTGSASRRCRRRAVNGTVGDRRHGHSLPAARPALAEFGRTGQSSQLQDVRRRASGSGVHRGAR